MSKGGESQPPTCLRVNPYPDNSNFHIVLSSGISLVLTVLSLTSGFQHNSEVGRHLSHTHLKN